MDASNPWVTIALAVIAAFSSAPFFKFVASLRHSKTKQNTDERERLDNERVKFEAEKQEWWSDQRKEALSVKLENKTYRDAMNEQANRNGWLEGQLARCNQENLELEAELKRLRNRKGPSNVDAPDR